MKKIFVSSTSDDLKTIREKIIKSLSKLKNYTPIAMEYFSAANEDPLEYCNDKICECDIYIGIIGFNYGSLTNNGISFTEQEYRTAENFNKQKLLFLQSEGMKIEFNKYRKVENALRFRSRLEEKHIVEYFSSAEDLIILILEALHNLSALSLGASKTSNFSSFLPPVKKFPPNLFFHKPYSMQSNFVGREEEEEILNKWKESKSIILFLQGMGGVGKSAFSWSTLKNSQKKSSFDGYFWWSFNDSNVDFYFFLKCLILYSSEGKYKIGSEGDIFCLTLDLLDFLKKKSFLVVIDGFERLTRAYSGLDGELNERKCQSEDFSEKKIEDVFKIILAEEIKSKIIINSRVAPKLFLDNIFVRQLPLKDLKKKDALLLFEKEGFGDIVFDIDQVKKKIGFHPLSIKLLTGYMNNSISCLNDLDDYLEKLSDLNSLVGNSYASCSSDAKELLKGLSAFREIPSLGEIEKILDITKSETTRVSRELIRRNLLYYNDSYNSYDMHPIIKNHVYRKILNKKSFHYSIYEYYSGFSSIDVKDSFQLDSLKPAIEYIYHGTKSNEFNNAFALYSLEVRDRLLGDNLNLNLIFTLLKSFFTKGIDQLPELNNPIDQANCVADMSYVMRLKGRGPSAKKMLQLSYDRLSDVHRLKYIQSGIEGMINDTVQVLHKKNKREFHKAYHIIMRLRISPAQRRQLNLLNKYRSAKSKLLSELSLLDYSEGNLRGAEIKILHSLNNSEDFINKSFYAFLLSLRGEKELSSEIFHELLVYAKSYPIKERSQIFEIFSLALLVNSEYEYSLESLKAAEGYAIEDKQLIKLASSKVLQAYLNCIHYLKYNTDNYISEAKKNILFFEGNLIDHDITVLMPMYLTAKGIIELMEGNGDSGYFFKKALLLSKRNRFKILSDLLEEIVLLEEDDEKAKNYLLSSF